MLYVCQ